jgi:hypothetical protein
MKQNITLLIDRQLLKKARVLASQRSTSVSAMLADELQRLVASEVTYEHVTYAQAKARAQAQLNAPFRMGGARLTNREALHDRQELR